MKHRRLRSGIIIGLVALGLLAGAALTAGPAQAFVSGPGPYYPEPAWDQIKGAGRFVVLTNWNKEAVLDKETGLVWERSPQTATATWSNARFVCTGKSTGGRKGWRLPSVHELASLIDPLQINPALPPLHPFTIDLSPIYWSATTHPEDPTFAWFVFFLRDGVVDPAHKTESIRVWCVRGGMNADVY